MALVVLVHCKAAQERLIRFLPNMIAKDTSLGAFVKDSQIKKMQLVESILMSRVGR